MARRPARAQALNILYVAMSRSLSILSVSPPVWEILREIHHLGDADAMPMRLFEGPQRQQAEMALSTSGLQVANMRRLPSSISSTARWTLVLVRASVADATD